MSRHCAARTEQEFLKSHRRSHLRSKTTFQLKYRLSWLRRSDTFSNPHIGLWRGGFFPSLNQACPLCWTKFQTSSMAVREIKDTTRGEMISEIPRLGGLWGATQGTGEKYPWMDSIRNWQQGKPGMTPCWVWSREKDNFTSPASELFSEYFKKSDWLGIFYWLYSWKNEKSNSSESFVNFTAGWKWKDQILKRWK